MNTYIALLRGINVGGHNKIKMAELKSALLSVGFESVTTYIQSGNIIFKDISEDIDMLEEKMHKTIQDTFGLDVPVLVIRDSLLQEILNNNPFAERLKNNEIEDKKMYFMLLCNAPDEAATLELHNLSFDPEEFKITPYVIYLFAANGYGKTKLHNNFFERKLKCQATTRNLKTLNKLLELSLLMD
ncbi:DUF1697 domain-containing protein [Aquimarina litoralis]|uniref:DUF1697 domain-containing protein n=1 Tax=Aquimarina litoralis TaxID=584605 RepID=UPI001C563730|nr:DUF1697 domain-containing protein [Aquimarina litoralis]MBW1297491.1 DUF1697 domain-containing protein [Aquimarina litoralis]